MDELYKGAIKAVVEQLPIVSPLEGVDPKGRVDVLASRLLEHVTVTTCGPIARGLYPRLKPAIDDLIVNAVNHLGIMKKQQRRRRPKKGGAGK